MICKFLVLILEFWWKEDLWKRRAQLTKKKKKKRNLSSHSSVQRFSEKEKVQKRRNSRLLKRVWKPTKHRRENQRKFPDIFLVWANKNQKNHSAFWRLCMFAFWPKRSVYYSGPKRETKPKIWDSFAEKASKKRGEISRFGDFGGGVKIPSKELFPQKTQVFCGSWEVGPKWFCSQKSPNHDSRKD